MLEFMDYVQTAFYASSRWNVDNSYASLTATVRNLLDFPIPQGLRLHISSLSAPNFATSYTLGSHGVVDGSLSFLYSSLSLQAASKSRDIPLNLVIKGYRRLRELQPPPSKLHFNEFVGEGERYRRKDALLYGRLYLPTSTLEASYIRRTSPTQLLRLNSVSNGDLPNGGTILALLQNDHGKYSHEYLFSTDSSLIGLRALYNFGHDPRLPAQSSHLQQHQQQQQQQQQQHRSGSTSSPPAHPWDHGNGRLSAGAEAYFSPINKSGGVSTGLRFTTLPVHSGFPYTMTLTLNPLMGNLSSAYAVRAGPDWAFCSRFDFNVYSYESDVVVGAELWRRSRGGFSAAGLEQAEWARGLIREGWDRVTVGGRDDDESGGGDDHDEGVVTGVLKARMSDKGKVGVLYECRVKELLVSLGASFDLKRRERMLGSIGLEVSFSS